MAKTCNTLYATHPDLVERFIHEGGYRIAPVEVRHSARLGAGREFVIRHAWANLGVGVLPNHNRRWGQKYRPAFAQLAAGANAPEERHVFIARDAEPGDWLRGTVHEYALRATLPPLVLPGMYKLACAIPNTRPDRGPDLQLALKTPRFGSWYELGHVEVIP